MLVEQQWLGNYLLLLLIVDANIFTFLTTFYSFKEEQQQHEICFYSLLRLLRNVDYRCLLHRNFYFFLSNIYAISKAIDIKSFYASFFLS